MTDRSTTDARHGTQALVRSGALDVMLALAHPCVASPRVEASGTVAGARSTSETTPVVPGGSGSKSMKGARAEQIRAEAWMSILELFGGSGSSSNSAVKRFMEIPSALASVVACAGDRSVGIQQKAAQVLALILSSNALTIAERSKPAMQDAVLQFVKTGDDMVTRAMGKASLGVVQSALEHGHLLEPQTVLLLARAAAQGSSPPVPSPSADDSPPRDNVRGVGGANCVGRREFVRSLGLLAADRRHRELIACHLPYELVSLLCVGLRKHGEEAARGALSGTGEYGAQTDSFFIKTLATIISSTSSDVLARMHLTAKERQARQTTTAHQEAKTALAAAMAADDKDGRGVKEAGEEADRETPECETTAEARPIRDSSDGGQTDPMLMKETPLRALVQSLPRVLLALRESLPRKSKQRAGRGSSILLRRERDVQVSVMQLAARLSLCVPMSRAPLLASGLAPLMVRTCQAAGSHDEATACNAASALFYLAHHPLASHYFSFFRKRARGTGASLRRAFSARRPPPPTAGGDGACVAELLLHLLSAKNTTFSVGIVLIKTLHFLVFGAVGGRLSHRHGSPGGTGGGGGGLEEQPEPMMQKDNTADEEATRARREMQAAIEGSVGAKNESKMPVLWEAGAVPILSGLVARALVASSSPSHTRPGGAKAGGDRLSSDLMAGDMRTPGSEHYFGLRAAFLAADLLQAFVYVGEGVIAEHVQAMGLEAWLDDCVLELVRRQPFVARSCVSETFTLGRALSVLEKLGNADLLDSFRRARTPLRASQSPDQHTHINQLFDAFDKDGSGDMDADELHLLLRQLGYLCSPDEAVRILTHMDANGDGRLDRHEFLNWWYYVHGGS